MKKTKLLMPIAAVSTLTAAIPAITLTGCSCNKGSASTKVTKQEWENAFKLLNERTDGVCWHASDTSVLSIGYGDTYDQANIGYKYTKPECGQVCSKYSRTAKAFGIEGTTHVIYSTMRANELNQTVWTDEEGKVVEARTATEVGFTAIFDLFNVYAPSFNNFKFNETTKEFEYVTETNDVEVVSSKVKFNADKQIEYIKSSTKEKLEDESYQYVNIDLHFSYDKSEVEMDDDLAKWLKSNVVEMTTASKTYTPVVGAETLEHGIILNIKLASAASYNKLSATFTSKEEAGAIASIFSSEHTEIYKNGNKLTYATDWQSYPPASAGNPPYIVLTEAITQNDKVEVAINLTSDFYTGQNFTFNLSKYPEN